MSPAELVACESDASPQIIVILSNELIVKVIEIERVGPLTVPAHLTHRFILCRPLNVQTKPEGYVEEPDK